MPLILGTNSIKDTGYNVANSLRFEKTSGDYIRRENTGSDFSASGSKKFTYSVWVKIANLGVFQQIYAIGSGGGRDYTAFTSDDEIEFGQYNSGFNYRLITNRVFRDSSAWYHIVFAVDTTQGTASNRCRLYVNGVEETSFSTETNPSQNQAIFPNTQCDSYVLGADTDFSNDFSGYFAEACFISDLQLDPTSFGEFDEDSPTIWKPKKITATFSNDSFYYEFKNSSAVGTDTSGLGNNAGTINALTAVDQSIDTCTNNFATLNAVSNPVNGYTLSEGNLEATVSGQSFVRTYIPNTIAPSSGKWYWESKLITSGGSDRTSIGICSTEENVGTGTTIPQNECSICTGYSRIRFTENGSTTEVDSFYTVPSGNDIFMYALDLDNTKFYFGINGVWWNYNTAETGGDPTSGSGYVTNSTNIIKGAMSLFIRTQAGAAATTFTNQFNFGSPPYAISSGNTDGNGYGNFEYAVPSSYYSLNTKNLAEYG